MYNIEYLKEFFKDDLFAMKRLGAEIVEAHNDYAKCRVEITKEHFNAKGIIMGGAVFSLADFTFAVATNQNEDYNTVSTTASISYVRPATGKYLYAEACPVTLELDGIKYTFPDTLSISCAPKHNLDSIDAIL